MERMILILTILCVATTSKSQQFQVRSFKQLTNDISAYIDTVRDLNDEACALVKVVCSQDFVFSSPLGIVKRKNETGEIWLYLPQGSTLLTLKHPQWGVLRDYQFLKPLESRMTYELVVDEPTETKMIPLTILTPPTITLVRKDTLIVFSPKQRHPSKPFNYFLTATLSVTNDHPMAGFRMAVYKQHGIYLSIASDLHSSPTISGETDNSSSVPKDEFRTYDTGRTHSSRMMLVAGVIHQINNKIITYEGGGWGYHTVAWEQMDGRWFENTDQSNKGWCAEVGMGYLFKKWILSIGAQTLKGKEWGINIGIGRQL